MKKRITIENAPQVYGTIVDRLKAPIPQPGGDGQRRRKQSPSDESNILITSADRREGRTTTTIGLAIATAAAKPRQRVLLVDLDHRRPAIRRLMAGRRAPAARGIVDLLHGRADLDDVLQPTQLENLYVLHSGDSPLNVPEDCQSEALKRLLARIASQFDYAFYDSPALNEHVDGRLLSEVMDRVVLVVRSDRSRKEEVVSARRQLPASKLVGAVVNDCRGPIPAFIARHL